MTKQLHTPNLEKLMSNIVKLYHYKPLSKRQHLDHLLNYLNQKIHFTPLIDFNDPFEAQFDFKPLNPLEIIDNEIYLKSYFQELRKKTPSLTIDELKDSLLKPEAIEMIGQGFLIRDIFENHGAICFTSNASNIPMWAHYANYHCGYCVVFEIDTDLIFNQYFAPQGFQKDQFIHYINAVFNQKENDSIQDILTFKNTLDNIEFIFTKINYTENRPTISDGKLRSFNNDYNLKQYIANNSFGVKYKQWQYEDEYRLVVNTNTKNSELIDLRFFPFIKVTGIIMGSKIGHNFNDCIKNHLSSIHIDGLKDDDVTKKTKQHIYQLASHLDIDVFTAECSEEKYEINIHKYDPLK